MVEWSQTETCCFETSSVRCLPLARPSLSTSAEAAARPTMMVCFLRPSSIVVVAGLGGPRQTSKRAMLERGERGRRLSWLSRRSLDAVSGGSNSTYRRVLWLLACFTTTPSREDMVRTDTLDLDTPTPSSTGRNLCDLTGERASAQSINQSGSKADRLSEDKGGPWPTWLSCGRRRGTAFRGQTPKLPFAYTDDLGWKHPT